MNALRHPARLILAAALLASLGACTVVPVQPGAYRSTPVYVETYPAYRYGYTPPGYYGNVYYERDRPRYDYYGDRRYQEHRRYDAPARIESPLENAARVHRDVRRSLGLPRLPGMP